LLVETGLVIKSTLALKPPAGYRFPREVIAVAVRWYLRYGLSYRDVEELLAERGIQVDHVTVYRWVQTFTAEFSDAARPSRHAMGIAGSSTRRTSRSPAAGRTYIGGSISMARSSMGTVALVVRVGSRH
jgi:hypothetical protein